MMDWQTLVESLVERVKAWRRNVLQTPSEQVTGTEFCRALSETLDDFVREIYQLAFWQAMDRAGKYYVAGHSEIALLATGGYGRRELCPFSDLDIAFVPLEEDDPFIDTLLRECFRLIVKVFMDNTDLKVGYAYRPLTDLPTLDTMTQAALLDSRLVVGYEPLVHKLREQLLTSLDALRFIRDRERERMAAYQRYHSTLLVAEPHLKEGAGGLRDGHTALWLLTVLHRIPTNDAWRKLQALLSPDEWTEFQNGYDFLLQIRNWLHLTAQRQQEVLLREYHHRFASTWCRGMAIDEETVVRGFHERLYVSMKALHHTLQLTRSIVAEATIPLGDGFVRKGNLLSLDEILNIETETRNLNPQIRILKAFELMQRYDLEPSAGVLRWLCDNAQKVSQAQNDPDAARAFLTVLTGEGDAPFGRVLRLMAQTGALAAYLPEWGKAANYVPSNAAHRWTVGEHGLATIEELHRLREAAWKGEFPWADVWSGVTDETVLFLTALVHDLGKIVSEPEHESVGAGLARQIGERLSLPEDRLQLLERLVHHHLALLSTARLRDIMATETIRTTTETVGDEASLKMMLLHSFADARAVGPQTFTEVEERMVLDLYFGVLHYLREQEASETSLRLLVRERVRELRQALQEVSDEEVRAFCEAVPPRYLLNTPLQTIAIHCQLVHQVRLTGMPAAEILTIEDSSFTEVVVCAPDDPQPGKLSKIAGALFACDADIRTASVFTLVGEPAVVLDTLWVTHDGRPLSDAKAKRVRETVLTVLTGEEKLDAILQRQGKPIIVPVQVRSIFMRNDISETHTVIHIVARDRKGLLYRLTCEISALGLDIQTAKIVTWGDIAEDAFYVVLKGKGKVQDELLDDMTQRLWERLS